MATNPTSTPAGASLLEVLGANRQPLGIALLVLGVALAAVPIVYGVLYGFVAVEVIVWGALLSVAALAAGAACLLVKPQADLTDAEQVRLVLLILGGVAGFLTTLLGLVLPFTWYAETFSGGLPEWSKNASHVWTCVLAVFGGLSLMFVSLLLARGVERSHPVMRRLLYGYNAFVSSFLLLAVLLLVNVLGYSPLPAFGALNKTYDWTANSVYTLSSATKAQLAAVKKPVRVLVLLPRRSRILPAVETMLKNCQAVTPQLTWEERSPELLSFEERAELHQKYDVPQDAAGMVVIYGTEPDTTSTFVKESDLFQDQGSSFEQGGSTNKKFTFKGEAALTTALDFVEGGKAKTVIYFTQGDGELSFTAGAGGEQGRGSVSTLVEVMGQGNFELKQLTFGPETKEVPADAGIVVIARPRTPLPESALAALRAYLRGSAGSGSGAGKHGKLIALLNAVGAGGARISDPGLDALLTEYGVRLGHDRVLSVATPAGNQVIVVAPQDSTNPLARRFAEEGDNFMFENVQTVQSETANPAFKTDMLLAAAPQLGIWSETDARVSAAESAAQARKDAQARKYDRFSKAALSVAVAVSDANSAPPIPGHEFMAQPGGPVMAVFGDASWISNEALESDMGSPDFSLFKSTVEWMREKADIGQQVKTKAGAEREQFSMDKITPAAAWRIEFTPVVVMLLGVVGLGLGVALVRRR